MEAALKYAELGFSVIPSRQDKKPLLKWRPYQKERASAEKIKEWWGKWPSANINLVTGKISNLLVIDTDTREGTKKIQSLLPETLIVPCETTPNGGMHFFFAHQDGLPSKARILDGIDLKSNGGVVTVAPSTDNNGKEWKPIDGLVLFDTPPPMLPEKLFNLLKKYALYNNNSFSLYRESTFDNKNSQHLSTNDNIDNIFLSHGRRNEGLFHVANQLFKAKTNQKMVSKVIEILGEKCNPPWGTLPEDGPISKIIESAQERSTRKERNLTEEVRQWILSTPGNFLSTDVNKCLHLTTREEEKVLAVILKRLSEGPNAIIKRFGSKRGSWTTMLEKAEIMNFVNVNLADTLEIRLPLNIHKKTVFFPKALIVLAGITGYGKTSYALNAIKENMNNWNIWYFNSEMSEQALHKKLSYFSDLRIDQWRMIAKTGWGFRSIVDEIQPNDFNVIDYLEPEGEKAFDIHSVLSEIVGKLEKGVALVTIQKKPGSQYGTGGIYSAKAASLVMNLEWGTLEITKNRFREEDPHPTWNTIDFDIVHGSRFEAKGDWYNPKIGRPEEKYKDFTGG